MGTERIVFEIIYMASQISFSQLILCVTLEIRMSCELCLVIFRLRTIHSKKVATSR